MIFIVNFGFSSYLYYVARQIELYNGKDELTLVLDKKYDKSSEFNTILMKDYSNMASEFASYYKSLFHTNANHTFELIWFQRFMFVLEYLESINYTNDFWIVDSDVMIYSNLKNVKIMEGKEFTKNVEQDPCFLWFKNTTILRKFCEFIIQYYKYEFKEIEEYYIKNYIEGPLCGGICEMTFLKWFSEKNSDICQDLSIPIDGWAFDRGIHTDDGYNRTLLAGKKIYWDKGLPYGIKNGTRINFYGLHCQGQYKNLIPIFFSGKALPSDIKNGMFWLFKNYLIHAPKNIIKIILGRF